MRKSGLILLSGVLLAATSLSPGFERNAEARPKFPLLFAREYPELKEKVRDAKCTVCHRHQRKNKKIRNAYGTDLARHLGGGDNWKYDEKVVEALRRTEDDESYIPGKTWGDIIRGGELPNADNGETQ